MNLAGFCFGLADLTPCGWGTLHALQACLSVHVQSNSCTPEIGPQRDLHPEAASQWDPHLSKQGHSESLQKCSSHLN